MRKQTTLHSERETLRYRAYELHQRGWKQTAIAEALGVTQPAVSKWLKVAKEHGKDALSTRPHPGRTPQLTAEQLTELGRLLAQGAPAHGFVGDVWTGPRVADVIARHFQVSMSERHARRIIHQLGWSQQTPARKAKQRDDDAVAQWLHERWPQLKREARRARRTILFVDESSVSLLPSVVKTWAPRGETPVLHEHLSKAHLSLISAVSPNGKAYYKIQRASFDSAAVIRFLDALHEWIPGKLLVLWDGAPIHHSQEIQDYLAQGASAWLQLEQMPSYAPELNPDEGIWNNLKHFELKNVCTMSLALLETVVIVALDHIVSRSDIIQAFFQHAGVA